MSVTDQTRINIRQIGNQQTVLYYNGRYYSRQIILSKPYAYPDATAFVGRHSSVHKMIRSWEYKLPRMGIMRCWWRSPAVQHSLTTYRYM